MLARLIASVLLSTAALTGAASAQDGRWWRAESANFIVYGDLNEQQVRNAAQSLEDFDLVLRALTRLESRENQNKLEVFLVRNLRGLFAQQENHAEGRYLLADMILEEMNAKSGEEARADLAEARRALVRSRTLPIIRRSTSTRRPSPASRNQ